MKKLLLATATAAVMATGLPTTASATHCNFTGIVVRVDQHGDGNIDVYAKQGALDVGTALFVSTDYTTLPALSEVALTALATQGQVFFNFPSGSPCTDFANPTVQTMPFAVGSVFQMDLQ